MGGNQQVGNIINQSTNGVTGMVNAGIDGNAQNMVNAGALAAGSIANNYDPVTGATINNVG